MALVHAKAAQAVSLLPPTEHLAAKTSALVKTDQFEAIHLVVAKGKEIPSHRVAGPLTLYCIEGHVELGLTCSTAKLSAGQWMFLEGGTPHSVRGIEASRLLLTIILAADKD